MILSVSEAIAGESSSIEELQTFMTKIARFDLSESEAAVHAFFLFRNLWLEGLREKDTKSFNLIKKNFNAISQGKIGEIENDWNEISLDSRRGIMILFAVQKAILSRRRELRRIERMK